MRRYTKARSTGDNWLDVLAKAYALAFADADNGCTESRQSLREFFGLDTLRNLYRNGLINWNPQEV